MSSFANVLKTLLEDGIVTPFQAFHVRVVDNAREKYL
jgi:hypothetical protein